jgi:uncharacterized NAD(P)/FAD-binding protein YdhS
MKCAIVGGGASGAIVALQCVQAGIPPSQISVFSDDKEIGRGIAYQRNPESFLLNVPAYNMSPYPEDLDHFLRWWAVRNDTIPDSLRLDFAPRTVYGQYLSEQVTTSQVNTHIQAITDMVALLREFEFLVIATGIGQPSVPAPLTNLTGSSRLIKNPWSAESFKQIRPDDSILVLGTGLTALDVVIGLQDLGHSGQITLLSRHGRLPEPHIPAHKGVFDRAVGVSIRKQLLHAFRNAGENWRDVMETIRPHVAELWQELSVSEQRQFLRHLRSWWDVHRHRSYAKNLARVVDAPNVSVTSDRVQSASASDDGLVLIGQQRTYTAQYVITATGPSPLAVDPPKIWQCATSLGWTEPDEVGLGFRVLPNGQLPGNSRVFTLGFACLGTFWECTSVPDLRRYAAKIVASIAS